MNQNPYASPANDCGIAPTAEEEIVNAKQQRWWKMLFASFLTPFAVLLFVFVLEEFFAIQSVLSGILILCSFILSVAGVTCLLAISTQPITQRIAIFVGVLIAYPFFFMFFAFGCMMVFGISAT